LESVGHRLEEEEPPGRIDVVFESRQRQLGTARLRRVVDDEDAAAR